MYHFANYFKKVFNRVVDGDILGPVYDIKIKSKFIQKPIKYISNNENVVTVDDSGLIKAVGGGIATISLEYQNDLYIDLIPLSWVISITPPSK